jgi:RND superfamily putative drug exporter
MPVVAFAEIGFAVALGVLLDTLVVRLVLVTALNLDIGGRMWWPSRLARDDRALSERVDGSDRAVEPELAPTT